MGCAALLFVAAPAFADEREDLLRQLSQEYEALSTSDCVAACRALGSMQRAADRLCEMDAGTACAEARAKVEDARKRVRAACPACVAERPEPPAPSTTPSPELSANAPPAESARGGCAGCSSATGSGSSFGVLVAAWMFIRRRRRR
jgi:uncharacterized protein (TIGR03382 family)